MTQQNFNRPVNLALTIGALILFSSIALAQTYPIGPSHLSGMKPGSVLFYNKYTSNPGNPDQGDTQINITNTNQTADSDIHLFLVDGATCSVADSFIRLIGDEYTRESDNRVANLAAVSVARVSSADVLPDVDGTASLIFNGTEYERLPASVALSSFNSQVDANT